MKQPSASTPDPEDFVSDFSVSSVDNIASNDASTLKEALIFLKGTLKAKEEELTRLHEEKEKAVESKLKLELMMENKLAELEPVGMGSKDLQVDWEKETTSIESRIELMVEKIGSKKELAEMLKMLFQAQKEKEAALESKNDLLVKELKQEKEEGTEDIQQSKEEVEQTTNLPQSHEETELIEEMMMLRRVMSEKEESFKREISEKEESFKREISEKEESFKRDISEKEESFRKYMQDARNQGQALHAKLAAKIASSQTKIAELGQVLDQFSKDMKFEYVWKKSGTKVALNNSIEIAVDSLSCNPLKVGTFEWKIRVEEQHDQKHMTLGVISSSEDDSLIKRIGMTKKSWGYDCYGFAYHDSESVESSVAEFPDFTKGSVLYFVLDLTGNGTLNVSVDGSSFVEIFSNMKSSLDEGEGFLPAVSLSNGAKIELCPIDP